jgi:hypothetical protein
MWCWKFKANSVKGQQTMFFEIKLEKREKLNNTISNTKKAGMLLKALLIF